MRSSSKELQSKTGNAVHFDIAKLTYVCRRQRRGHNSRAGALGRPQCHDARIATMQVGQFLMIITYPDRLLLHADPHNDRRLVLYGANTAFNVPLTTPKTPLAAVECARLKKIEPPAGGYRNRRRGRLPVRLRRGACAT